MLISSYVFVVFICQMCSCKLTCVLTATDVCCLSQLPAVSSVTSAGFVISHVSRAGLDKAPLGTTRSVRIHPAPLWIIIFFMKTNLVREREKRNSRRSKTNHSRPHTSGGFYFDAALYSTDHLHIVVMWVHYSFTGTKHMTLAHPVSLIGVLLIFISFVLFSLF